ncbi:MAG: hypothetical protein RI922_782 [Bacteroidota bacterium]|jgi:predicted Zn-dependent protease
MIKLKLSLSIFSLLSFVTLYSQVDFNNYTTAKSKGKIPVDFTKQTYTKVQEDIKKGKEELNQNQERVFFEGTNYAIDEILHSGLVIYGDEMSNYISEVADHLLKNDSDLRSQLRFYIIKSNSSNAFSTDQGIVFVTTGLLSQLTSEAQIAYVLAHEISHYTEKHVVETFDYKTKGYRQSDRIASLSQYSKEKEFEADKLGVKLYNAAGYSEEEIISTFDVLMYSYLPFDEVVFPISYFNKDGFYVPNTLFPSKKYEIKAIEDYDDSNSSHPNIKKRKEAAEIEIGTYSNWTDVTQRLGEERFKEIRNIARFESVRNDIIDNQYGNALYSIFILEKDFPNSMYLKRMKAQTWMNLMLYKAENKSSQTIQKTSELEGESASLHFFLKKLSKEALISLSLRQVYDLYKSNQNDEEIKAVYTKFIKDLAENSQFKLEKLSKKSFNEAAQDFLKISKDSIKPVEKDTVTKTSKYDKIKSKKNADNPTNFDSTKFYLYGLNDILEDKLFADLYAEKKADWDKIEKEKEDYNALSKKEKKAYDKEKALNSENLGIKELIVVEPMVRSYKHGEVDNIKSEKLESDFSEAIESSAELAGIKTYSVDSRTLATKGTQGYNERSILINMLNQIASDEDINIFPVDYQLLKQISTDYGTSKVMFSLVEHEYSANISASGVLSSIIIYPILLIYVPVGILSGSNTEMNMLILDLESGKIENGVSYYFKDSPKKLQLGAHVYDILKTLGETN